MELTALEEEISRLRSEPPSRTCQDILLEHPVATSGNYNIDPNLGSSLDSIKSYCDFDGPAPKTCVDTPQLTHSSCISICCTPEWLRVSTYLVQCRGHSGQLLMHYVVVCTLLNIVEVATLKIK